MSFEAEPKGYIKTALSDLQGSWANLRDAVVENYGFQNSDKLLLHIDEGMSWESVRDLKIMKSTLLLVHNIATQSKAPKEVLEFVEDVRQILEETLEAIAEGDAK